jgi:hypothetical protein
MSSASALLPSPEGTSSVSEAPNSRPGSGHVHDPVRSHIATTARHHVRPRDPKSVNRSVPRGSRTTFMNEVRAAVRSLPEEAS